MAGTDYSGICGAIGGISPYVRFAGVIGRGGELLAHYRRPGLEPMLDAKSTHYQFSHVAMKTGMESYFDRSLGPVEFVWEERERVQTIAFAIDGLRVWVSIDKKVVRSEVLRIIDACLPLVRRADDAGRPRG